jgi:hypothetical protein
VRGIPIGVQECDRHGVVRAQPADELVAQRIGELELLKHLAVAADPFVDRESSFPIHQRLGRTPLQIDRIGAHPTAELDDVSETSRGHESGPREAPLEQGVRRYGRPVDDADRRLGARAQRRGSGRTRRVDPTGQELAQLARVASDRREELLRPHLSRDQEHDRVGERASDVDGEMRDLDRAIVVRRRAAVAIRHQRAPR